MKPRFLSLLLLIAGGLFLASPAHSAQKPTKADIAQIFAEAATYEPGQSREVTLVALAGSRAIYGFRGDVMGKL